MVELVLAAVPALAGVLVLVAGLGGLAHPDSPGSPIPIVFAALVVAVLVLSLVTAVRRRRETNTGAWILLMAGVVLFSSGELLELVFSVHDSWIEDVLRLAAYVPLTLFVASVASPLILVARRRTRIRTLIVAAISVLVALTASVLPAFVWGAAGGLQKLVEFLTAARPVLDVLVVIPLLGVLGTVGLRRSSRSYVYVALGLALLAVSDVFFHYELHTGSGAQEVAAFAAAIAALGYFILAAARRLGSRRAATKPPPV